MPFARWSGAYGGEWGAERVVFTGEGEPISYAADEEDRVMIDQDTAERLGSIEVNSAHFGAADFALPPLIVGGERSERCQPEQFLRPEAQRSPHERERAALRFVTG